MKTLTLILATLVAFTLSTDADAKRGGRGRKAAAVEIITTTTTTTLYRNGAERAEDACPGGEWDTVKANASGGCNYYCGDSDEGTGLSFTTPYPCPE